MSLQVWLPLNGDLHNLGLKKYNLSMFRGTEVYNNNGKIGKCFYANGVNTIKILNIIPDFYNYTAYSLCAWIYIEAQNTSHSGSGVISAGNWNSLVLNLGLSDWSTDHYTRLRISGTNWSRTYQYNFSLNTWYHIVVSSDNNKTYAYINGVLIGNSEASFLPTSIEGNDMCIGGATYYSGMQFFGRINDVRIYDHCLSAKEAKKISKGLVLHYLLNNSNNILTKYDKLIYTEPDNSLWLRIARHNNPGSSGYFTKTASWETGVYLDSNRWYDVSVVNLLSNFEFMVKLTATSTATETKYRWILTKNPLQAVYNDVKPASVTRITTTGYTDGTFGGLWKMNSSARLCIANNSSGNWFGAIGSWTAYLNGIPGYPNTTITSGYIDLYVRIDNLFNLIYDSSGYNNNIYSNGSKPITTINNSNKYKNYSNFFAGGRLATIVAASTFMPKDMITVSIWIKTNAASNRFLSCTEGGGFNFEPASGAVSLPLYISGKGYTRVNGTTTWTDLSDNNWHMITATYDRLNTKLYIDGNLDTSTASSYPNIDIGYNSSTPFTLGAEAQTIASPIAGTYVGGLSDCRIYATALSADDIKELYRTSKIVSGTAVSPRSLE